MDHGLLRRCHCVGQRDGNRRRHETGHIAAQARDLAHQRRRNEAVLLGRGQEQGLHLRDQVAVHAGQLELVFEIGHRAQAAQQHAGTDFLDEVRQQRIEAAHFHVRVMGHGLAGQLHAQLERQGRALAGAVGDADDQALEQRRGAVDQVDVTVGDRVEGAGIDRDAGACHSHSGTAWKRRRSVYQRRADPAPVQGKAHLAGACLRDAAPIPAAARGT